MAIIREQRQVTSGGPDDKVQAFFANIFQDYRTYNLSFNTFNVPQYTTIGGTLDFYQQDPLSIFTNLVRPFVRFTFTANTSSLTGETSITHNIYRLDYPTYMSYYDAYKTKDDDIRSIVEEIDEVDEFGKLKRKFVTTTDRNNSVKSAQPKSGNMNLSLPEKKQKNPGFQVDNDDTEAPIDLNNLTIADIQKFMDVPVYTASTQASGITTSIYNLYLDEYVKKTGNTKTQLFLDKSQYLLDTVFRYKVERNDELLDYYTIANSADTVFIDSISTAFASRIETNNAWNSKQNSSINLSAGTYESSYFRTTDSYVHTIDRGDFQGLKIKGRFFSYFIVPDKPKIESPIPQGTLTTFTPEFFWSNGEGADEYLIQITYNTADTVFSGQVFSYPVEKSDKYKETFRTKNSLDVTNEVETDKTIRKYQVPVKSNTFFRYRVGNIKSIINIFGVKQSVVTFSDSYTANTSAAPLTTYVYSESDSPYTEEIQGWVTPPGLLEDSLETYSLSGVISGSVVTGATITLTYPNNNYVVQTTDETGFYMFTDLDAGNYVMTTFYRGYDIDVRSISLSGNTNESFKLRLLWGNSYDTWGKMANENYFL